MKLGDTIMFRGRRRFVVCVRSNGLILDRVRPSGYPAPYVHYTVGEVEKKTIKILSLATEESRARARALLEAGCMAWTKIVWDGDEPTYVHTPSQRLEPKPRTRA